MVVQASMDLNVPDCILAGLFPRYYAGRKIEYLHPGSKNLFWA